MVVYPYRQEANAAHILSSNPQGGHQPYKPNPAHANSVQQQREGHGNHQQRQNRQREGEGQHVRNARKPRRSRNNDLGHGWVVFHNDQGVPYYYNKNTGETTWNKPQF